MVDGSGAGESDSLDRNPELRRIKLRRLGWFWSGCYLISFVLPMYDGWGFGAFYSAFLFGFIARDTPSDFPANKIILLWTSNVLTWIVVGLLARGRYRSSTIFGLVAIWFASFAIRPLNLILPHHRPSDSVYDIGFWVWWGSMIGLTSTAFGGWKTQDREKRPKMTIGSVMLLVILVAMGLMVYR